MSRPRSAGRRGLWPAALAGWLLACGPNQEQTNTPKPRDDARLDRLEAVEDQLSAAEADKAAKQAAAKEVMEKVKDRDPEEEKKKMAQSRVVSAEARAKLAKGRNADAVATARKALRVHEQNVDAMLVIAEVYYKEGKYELVRAVTSSALQVDPERRTPADSSRAYNLQGFAMIAMGEQSTATQSFKKAAEVDDKNAAAWNNLGTRYLDAGDVATATACFQYAIELDPRFYKAQLNFGAALRAGKRWEEAEAAMLQALKLRPNYPEAYFNLGVLYLDADPFPNLETTQRLNKAIANLSKYRDLAPNDPKASADKKTAPGAAKKPPPRVSKERADDYIRVANKGLDREKRRLEREKGRELEAKNKAAAGQEPGGEPAVAGEPGAEPGVASPEPPTSPGSGAPPGAPAPQDPGASPAPQGPGVKPQPASPTTPTPQGPGVKPTQPATPTPQGPGVKPTPTQPATPAPTQPVKPTPTKPAPQPVKPTPTQPAKPTQPQKPGGSPPPAQKPSPQKPTPQKPGATSASQEIGVGAAMRKKNPTNPSSRGTRYAPSTLNSTEAGALTMVGVDLASCPVPSGARVCVLEVSDLSMVASSSQVSASMRRGVSHGGRVLMRSSSRFHKGEA